MMKYWIPMLLVIVALCSCKPGAPEQQVANPDVDAIFNSWSFPETPGAALGVIQNGKLVYAKGYGSADLEHDIPISPGSVFYIGSVSKQFVTFCILLLEEDGRVNLDDEIQVYLPDFPRYESPLTVRHFIHHTSGVRDYLTLMALKGRSYLDHINDEEVYELIKRQRELNFTPGEKYLYSNSCYFMLAMIVEKASGMSIREFAKANIFDPLGMTNTLFYDDNTDLIKNRVFSYMPNENAFDNTILRFDLVGSGGIYSNVEDLVKWDQNFYNNKLGKGGQDIIERMHEEGMLNNGESSGYAFALVNDTYKGLRTVSHGGALAGYRSILIRFPDQQFSVVILANRADAAPGDKAMQVADVYLKEHFTVEKENQDGDTTALDSKVVEAYNISQMIGRYEFDLGVVAEITAVEGKLQLKQEWDGIQYPLERLEGNTFRIENEEVFLTFSEMDEDMTQTMTVDDNGQKDIGRRKADTSDRTFNLNDYAGKYYSEELDVSSEFYVKDNNLFCKVGSQQPYTLERYDQDQFLAEGTLIRFQRSNSDVTGLEVDAGRVTNLKFAKTE